MKERKLLVLIQIILVVTSLSSIALGDSLMNTDLQWIAVDTEGLDYPQARSYHEAVYDSKSNVLIMTHGQFSFPNSLPKETWVFSFNDSQWTNMKPTVIPDSRTGFGFAYDSKNDVSIMFSGGNNNTQEKTDTWAYNYTSNTWVNMRPKISPPARAGHEMVFDSKSGKIILFGGRENILQNGRMYNDVWTYEYEKNLWTNITPSINPPARWYFNMIYESKDDKVILFGGYSNINTIPYITRHDFRNDTWAFDVGTNSWTELKPSTAPIARGYSSGTYHEQMNKFIIYGGWNQDKNLYFNDTWAYDYSTNEWTELDTNAPNMRTHSAMVYSNLTNEIILYGGYFIPYGTYGDPTTWALELKPNSSIPFTSTMIIPALALVVLLKRIKMKG